MAFVAPFPIARKPQVDPIIIVPPVRISCIALSIASSLSLFLTLLNCFMPSTNCLPPPIRPAVAKPSLATGPTTGTKQSAVKTTFVAHFFQFHLPSFSNPKNCLPILRPAVSKFEPHLAALPQKPCFL